MRGILASSALASILVLTGCPRDNDHKPTGLVVDASAPVPTPSASAAVDVAQCPGCQLNTIPSWTFEGIYSDAACTEPLAQTVTPACAVVQALGATNLTYVDEVGLRKAGETANVTLTELVAVSSPRFRKAGTKCVKANEAGTAVTPPGCSNSRVCRDAQGGLVCTGCRTFASGCPDVIETRTYALINDPGLKQKPGGGGGGGNARLAACCNALTAQAKSMGASPEAGVLMTIAAQCHAIAANGGNAPELAAFRSLLAGKNIPALCNGL